MKIEIYTDGDFTNNLPPIATFYSNLDISQTTVRIRNVISILQEDVIFTFVENFYTKIILSDNISLKKLNQIKNNS